MNNLESIAGIVKELRCIKEWEVRLGEGFVRVSRQITRKRGGLPVEYKCAMYITPISENGDEFYESHSNISIISPNRKAYNVGTASKIIRDSKWLDFFNFNERLKSFVEEKSRKYKLWSTLEKKETQLKTYIEMTKRKFYARLPVRYENKDSNYHRLKDFYFNLGIREYLAHFIKTISKT